MRHVFVAVALLGVSLAAAPLKPDAKAERKRLDILWHQLDSADPVERLRAVLALADAPEALAFIQQKVPPLHATKAATKPRLDALDGDATAIEKEAARDELRYFHPSMGATPKEQFELSSGPRAKAELLRLWAGERDFEPGEGIDFTIAFENRKDGPYVAYSGSATTPGGTARIFNSFRIKSVGEIECRAWNASAHAMLVLHGMKSERATSHLTTVAKGHPEALPTRTAAKLLKSGMSEPDRKQFEASWTLCYDEAAAFGSVGRGHRFGGPEIPRLLLGWCESPSIVPWLKEKLPAIAADRKKTESRLDNLHSDNDATAAAAYDDLLYFHPSLAFELREQVKLAANDRAKSRL